MHLYIITYSRILPYLYLFQTELPVELGIHNYDQISMILKKTVAYQ